MPPPNAVGTVCAVAECNNSTLRCPNLSFHRFPREQNLRKIWIDCCKRKDEFNYNTSRICSTHFAPEDFVRDLKAELLGLPERRMLKENSVPHIELRKCNNKLMESIHTRKRRMLLKEEQEETIASLSDERESYKEPDTASEPNLVKPEPVPSPELDL